MVKNLPTIQEIGRLIPRSGRSPGSGNGNSLCQDSPMDRGGLWPTVHWGCKESDMTEHSYKQARGYLWNEIRLKHSCIQSV